MTQSGLAPALSELGVASDTLSDVERQGLDEQGYLYLEGLIHPGRLEGFRRRLRELAEEEGEHAGSESHQEVGTSSLSDLINKDPMFEICFTHPRVLAAAHHVLGDFKVNSLNSRAAQPGEGHQALHPDASRAVAPGDFEICNSIWLLDDFTSSNGSTRLVPGSHRWARMPADDMDDITAPHPDEIRIIAPAGTVVVFNGHVWHGGTRNRTSRPRRAMTSSFVRRDCTPQLDQATYLRLEVRARLSPAALYILGVVERSAP